MFKSAKLLHDLTKEVSFALIELFGRQGAFFPKFTQSPQFFQQVAAGISAIQSLRAGDGAIAAGYEFREFRLNAQVSEGIVGAYLFLIPEAIVKGQAEVVKSLAASSNIE